MVFPFSLWSRGPRPVPRAAERWLAENREAVGVRSTVDLSGLIPPKDGPLSGQSIIKRKQPALSNAADRSS